MKKRKFFTLLVCIITVANTLNAQSAFNIDATQSYTSFKFTDAQGSELNKEYSGLLTGSYGISYRYTTDFGLIIRPGLWMRNAGASLVYDNMNYSWKLQYADARLGLGYVYKIKRINPYFIASGYYSKLLRGIQVLNNEDFNITESGLLNKADYGVLISPGIDLVFSEYISGYIELNYLMGICNLEKDEGQTAKNFAYGATLGVSFKITKQ